MTERLRSAARPLVACCLGLAAALGSARVARRFGGAWSPGPVVLWVADRDGGRVVGLDRELFASAAVPLVAPVRLAPRRDGGAWVVDAVERRPGGASRLLRVGAGGRVEAVLELGVISDLADLDGEDALVCEPDARARDPDPNGAAARVLVVTAEGTERLAFGLPGATCVAGRGARLLAGCADGGVLLLDLLRGAGLVAARDLGREIVDVAPGPDGGWWALQAGPENRVHLLAANLAPRWDCAARMAALELAPIAEEERVWLASREATLARLYGPLGSLEAEAASLPLSGLGPARAAPGGGVFLAAPGAILELDREGLLARTRGGFDFVSAVARAGSG